MRLKTLATIIMSAAATAVFAVEMPFVAGEKFADTEGQHINAHGGGIMAKDGTYYWYGEHRGDGTPGSGQKGVALYTSDNLRDWTNRGIVLSLIHISEPTRPY